MTRRRRVLFIVMTLIVVVGIAELGLRSFFSYRSETSVLERRTLSVYKDKPWADQFFEDMFTCAGQRDVVRAEGKGSYKRYVLHDITLTCETQYINYDGENLTRKTWSPESIPEDAKVYRIGMFGGSTMMGLGTIDDLTIASHFSKLVNVDMDSGGAYYVVENYGVSSYTLTQSLMKLILLLREGKEFDYVVFYNGTNDIDNAYDAGVAGALIGEKALVAALQGSSFSEKAKTFIKNQVFSCGICKAVVVISRNVSFLRDTINPTLLELKRFLQFRGGDEIVESDDGTRKFAAEIANYYVRSHHVLDVISRAYGFGYAEFWQPALVYGGEPVGDEERLFLSDARLTDERIKTLYNLTRENVLAADMENFYDLSDVLNGREEANYTDAVHISGDGNGVVAERILELIGGELPGAR